MSPPTSPGAPPAFAVALKPKFCVTVRRGGVEERLFRPSQFGLVSNVWVRVTICPPAALMSALAAATAHRNAVRNSGAVTRTRGEQLLRPICTHPVSGDESNPQLPARPRARDEGRDYRKSGTGSKELEGVATTPTTRARVISCRRR